MDCGVSEGVDVDGMHGVVGGELQLDWVESGCGGLLIALRLRDRSVSRIELHTEHYRALIPDGRVL